jgi:hypothetical protein
MASDNFNGVDGTVVDIHDPNWTIASGSQALSNATIQGDTLQVEGFRQIYMYYAGSAEGISQVIYKAGTTDLAKVGPAVDVSATNKGYSAFFSVSDATNWVTLELDKDGLFVSHVSVLTFARNQDHTIKIVRVVNGPNVDIEVFVDDVSVLTRTDASPLTAANDGLFLNNGSRADAVNFDDWASTFATGQTLTGPDSTTDGTATQATGTGLDTVTTFSLISGTYEIEQTIDGQTATTLDYVANSGVNDCVPGTPVSGVPLEATITAPGITPYVVQQKVDDGVNPPTTRNITLNAPATHDVIQTMIASANTIDDQSIFGASWIDVEDNMQAYVPKVVDGVNFTWAADGTFTTDQDKTVNVRVAYLAPSTLQYGCIDFTIQGSTIISSGMITGMIEPMISNMIEDM